MPRWVRPVQSGPPGHFRCVGLSIGRAFGSFLLSVQVGAGPAPGTLPLPGVDGGRQPATDITDRDVGGGQFVAGQGVGLDPDAFGDLGPVEVAGDRGHWRTVPLPWQTGHLRSW
jgi:hypothetical protein